MATGNGSSGSGGTPGSGGMSGNGSSGNSGTPGGGGMSGVGSSGSGGTPTSAGTGGTAGPGSGGRTDAGGGLVATDGGAGGSVGSGGATGQGGGPGAGGSSGVFIDIAGTMVPRERAIVFLHLGHSNMVGYGTGTPELQDHFFKTQARLWSYNGTAFTPAKERTAVDVDPMLAARPGGGPGTGLLKAAAALAGPDYHFISVAKAIGSLDTTQWQKGGPLYAELLSRTRGLKGKVTFGGVFIMLGVTDRHLVAANWPKFPDRFAQLVKDLRADLGEPNLPILECDYELGATAPDIKVGSAFAKAMMPMLASLPGKIPNLALVSTEGVGYQDDHHFNLAGHKLWTERAIMVMKEKGWFPWTK